MKESPLLYIPLVLGESAIFIGLIFMLLNTVVEFFNHVSEYKSLDGTELIKEVK